jgi:hypothetical protein
MNDMLRLGHTAAEWGTVSWDERVGSARDVWEERPQVIVIKRVGEDAGDVVDAAVHVLYSDADIL